MCAGPKRRGRKPSIAAGEARDGAEELYDGADISPLSQQVDMAYLEELKRQAALEEQAMKEGKMDAEADPRRINFHK